MALNASKVQGVRKEREPMAVGTYPARLVSVIDIGLQPGGTYNGKQKDNIRKIALTYEFLDEFMKDEDGQDQKDKPRWLTEFLPFHNLKSTKAICTLRYKALDPDEVHGGDWEKLPGTPCNVTVVHNPRRDGLGVYENIGSVSPMRQKDAEKADPLRNEPVMFDMDNPSLVQWERIPAFIQNKMKENLEYAGSALEKLLGKGYTPPKQDTPPAKGKPALKLVEPEPEEEADAPPY